MRFSTLRIAWRNLGRNRKRTALAVLAVAVGQFGLLASQGVMRGYLGNIRRAITGPMVGHAQVHAPEWRDERAMDLYIDDLDETLGAIRGQDAVESAAARVYAPVLAAPKREAFVATVVGVNVEVESGDYGLLAGLEEPLRPAHVLVGYRLARKMDVQPGDEVAVIGQAADGSFATGLYDVQQIIKCPADLVNQSGIVMPLTQSQQLFMLQNRAHEIVVRARPGVKAGALARGLRGAPALEGLEVKSWQELMPELTMIIEMADYVGYFVIFLIFIAAVAGIANTLMMATFERMHEFGMLLALGSRPLRLVRLILVEAALLGFVGVVVGTLLGGAFVGITSYTGIDMASWGGEQVEDLAFMGLNLPLDIHPWIEFFDVALGFVSVMITSLIAAAWPATVAARLEPMEAMRA